MKTIFNKALWASAIGACTLSLGSCTDLSETIYDTIASEKYEFTEKDRAAMFAPVYSSLRDVYWGWYSYADMMDQSSDSWCIPYRISTHVQQGGMAEPRPPENERRYGNGLRGLQGNAARRGLI